MKSLLIAGLALLLLGLLGYALFMADVTGAGARPAASAPPPALIPAKSAAATAAAPALAELAGTRAALAGSEQSAESEHPPLTPGSGSCAVLVRVLLEPELEPLVGVQLVLLVGPHGERREVPLVTGPEGTARLELEEPTQLFIARVARGERNAPLERFLSRGVAAGEVAEIELLVSPGALLAGRVVDGEGEPVPGANLLVWSGSNFDPARRPDLETSADSLGRFELEGMPSPFRLSAAAPGWACVQGLRGELPPGTEARELEVVLLRAAWIEGTVVTDQGRPVANCELTMDPSGGTSSRDVTPVRGVTRFHPVKLRSSSGADGRFRIGPLPARTWNVRATHPQHPMKDQTLAPEKPDQVIELAAGTSVVGTVFTHLGSPAVDARVQVRLGDQMVVRSRTDEEGAFALHGLVPGRGFLAVHAVGEQVHQRPIEVGAGATVSVDVQLEAPLRISGRVLDEDGTPAQGAHVRIVGDEVLDVGYTTDEPTTLEYLLGINKARTDEAGEFVLGDLRPGRYGLEVAAADAPQATLQLEVSAGEEDLVVRLDRKAMEQVVLLGRVLDSETGAPVQRYTLTPMILDEETGSGFGKSVAVQDEQGDFRSAGYKPGTINLSVHAEGYAVWRSGNLQLEQGEHRFDIGLYPARWVELELVDQHGTPLSGNTTVTLLHGDLQLQIERGTSSWTSNLELTGGRGLAHGLPAAVLRVMVHPRHQAPQELPLDLRVQPREPVRLVVEIYPATQIDVLFVGTQLEGDLPAQGDAKPWEWMQSLLRAGDTWLLDADLTARFRSADRRTVATARVRVAGEGEWTSSWNAGDQGGSQDGTDFPGVQLPVPGRPVEVELRAPGYVTQVIPIDPTAPNGGLPLLLHLRRR